MSADTDPTPDRTDPQDRNDAAAEHAADRPPTPEEERIADEQAQRQPDSVAEHYEEMAEIGAEVQGEGHIP